MPGIVRKLTSVVVAASLTLVPAGAFAANPGPTAAPAVSTGAAGNPWLTLSAMTSTSSSAAATAAAQGEGGGAGFPPLVPLAIILATIAVAIWIAVDDDEDLDFVDISPD